MFAVHFFRYRDRLFGHDLAHFFVRPSQQKLSERNYTKKFLVVIQNVGVIDGFDRVRA